MKNIIPAVNLHLTKRCNMKCGYCFAGFAAIHNQINFEDSKKLLVALRAYGFEKVNFVGGEPLLIPKLDKLILFAKSLGFYTSIATNGYLLNVDFIKSIAGSLDMIGISIDSLNAETNKQIGRMANGRAIGLKYYLNLVNLVNEQDILLKINTVVSKLNYNENFIDFINAANPDRWKVFQVLKVENENSINFNRYEVSEKEFKLFTDKHKAKIMNKNCFVEETNDVISGSYLMVNPEGEFFDNTKGKYTVSENILRVGIDKALSQINFDISKFKFRKGDFYRLKQTITA